MIEMRGLRYRYRGGAEMVYADLSLAAGEHLLLRGASGSGKSTLLALLAGLLTPTAGQVLVAGQDLAALRPSQRDAWRGAALGFMPQRLHLSSALSVEENLCLPYLSAGLPLDAERMHSLLGELGLGGLLQRRPHQLSLGQAQRVALLRALLRRPRLLLADEPTANLDDESAAACLALLTEVCDRQGTSLVLATHDSRAVLALGQRLRCHVLPRIDQETQR